MTIQEALADAIVRLRASGLESPELESEFLLAALLGRSRSDILLGRKLQMPLEKRSLWTQWVEQRSRRKPLAYITGNQPFEDKSFEVNSEVLIPRPETELLVTAARRWLDSRPLPNIVVDVGTGSGVIAVSLCGHPHVRRIIAVDISASALVIAQRNAAMHQTSIEWRQSSLLDAVTERADLIVANLPYIRRAEIDTLAPELHWEPRLALDGGEDGLDLVRSLIEQAPRALKPHGALFLEIGWDQSKTVEKLLAEGDMWQGVQVTKDYGGHDRLVTATRTSRSAVETVASKGI